MKHPLEQYREAQKLSRAQLAERIGVSRQTVFRIERHGVVPTPATIRKLAEISNGAVGPDAFYQTAAE